MLRTKGRGVGVGKECLRICSREPLVWYFIGIWFRSFFGSEYIISLLNGTLSVRALHNDAIP